LNTFTSMLCLKTLALMWAASCWTMDFSCQKNDINPISLFCFPMFTFHSFFFLESIWYCSSICFLRILPKKRGENKRKGNDLLLLVIVLTCFEEAFCVSFESSLNSFIEVGFMICSLI
jgi:hypothetical protein